MEQTCGNPICEKVYDTEDYGVGPVYCSPRCRHTKAGRRWETGQRGRLGRYPRATPKMRGVVLAMLNHNGWNITRYNPDVEPYRMVIQKGHLKVNLCIGGGFKNEKWAEASAFIHPDWKRVYFASTCRKAKQTHQVPLVTTGKTVERTYYYPCLKTWCMKCTRAAWLKMAMDVDNDFDKMCSQERLTNEASRLNLKEKGT